MNRLVAVSNRLLPGAGRSAAGGLAVALGSAMEERGGLWFGWSGQVSATPLQPPLHSNRGKLTLTCVDLGSAEYADFYLGFCNTVLWPLFHGFVARSRQDTVQFAAYLSVNRRYARALLPLLDPGDLIWVHNYKNGNRI